MLISHTFLSDARVPHGQLLVTVEGKNFLTLWLSLHIFLFPEVEWQSHNEVGSLSYVDLALSKSERVVLRTAASLDVMKHFSDQA